MPNKTDASLARRMVRARAARVSALLLGGLFVGFLLLVVVFIEYRRAIDWVDHTHEVISAVEELQSTLSDTESGQRGYLLLPDPVHLAAYEEGRERSRRLLDSIGTLTADNPAQQDKVKALRTLTADRLDQIAGVLRQATDEGLDQALATIREGKGASTMAAIRRLTATMRAEEVLLLARRSRHATILELLMIAYGVVFVTRSPACSASPPSGGWSGITWPSGRKGRRWPRRCRKTGFCWTRSTTGSRTPCRSSPTCCGPRRCGTAAPRCGRNCWTAAAGCWRSPRSIAVSMARGRCTTPSN
ncbi:CHASE3 domain sensor protein [Azospirillum melinis]|nr:CHASE3 domain sensor protein [Azospirillum melinis]